MRIIHDLPDREAEIDLPAAVAIAGAIRRLAGELEAALIAQMRAEQPESALPPQTAAYGPEDGA